MKKSSDNTNALIRKKGIHRTTAIMKNIVYSNIITKYYMTLHTELNARKVDYSSDINVMGIKMLKDL